MSTTVGQLDIRMNLELQRLEGQITTANKKVASMSKRMQSDVSKAAKGINSALGALGVGLSVGAVVAYGRSILNLGGEIRDLAAEANISTDALQTLSRGVSGTTLTYQEVSRTLVFLGKSIEGAFEGSKGLVDSFAKLELNADRLRALAPERQLEAVAKAVFEAKDQARAFNGAMEVLGAKNAPKLRAQLDQLARDGFDKLAEATKNLRVSPENLKTLDDAADKLNDIWTSLKVISATAFVATVEIVTKVDASAAENMARAAASPNRAAGVPFPQMSGANVAEYGARLSEASQKSIDPFAEKSMMRADEMRQRLLAAADEKAHNAEVLRFMEEKAKLDAAADLANYGNQFGQQFQADAEAEAAAIEKRNKLLEEGAAVAASMRTPIENYNVALSRLTELQAEGAITADVYDKAVTAEGEAFQKATNQAGEYAGTLEELEEPMDQFSQTAAAMWENIADRTSSALSDMLLDADAKFSDFVGGIARMIADIAIRMAVINPILNSAFGLTGTNALPALFGYAGGGEPAVGQASWVGEKGKELFVPKEPGMIIPNNRLGDIGGGSTTVINADLRGASVEAVMRLEQYVRSIDGQLERRAIGAVANERRRGGGSGRSLGA